MGITSALVCTRNRPVSIVRAIESLLAGDHGPLEVLVVDQSDGPDTEEALAPLRADTRLRYLRSATRGKGMALNAGLQEARGEIVVCTDDDCEARPGWAVAMARTLEGQPGAAIAFCNVVAAPHDPSQGYVPTYERSTSRLVRSLAATCAGHGIGAGMAVRRDVVLSLGGFDEAFGPGAIFPSGDDWDITGRLLLTGWHAYESAELSIVHDGFRTFCEGRAHARRDWTAIGAVCAKPLRAGRLSAIVVPLWEFGAHALWPPVFDLLRLRKPRGLARILGFLEGFFRGLAMPVDRKTLLFAHPATPPGPTLRDRARLKR